MASLSIAMMKKSLGLGRSGSLWESCRCAPEQFPRVPHLGNINIANTNTNTNEYRNKYQYKHTNTKIHKLTTSQIYKYTNKLHIKNTYKNTNTNTELNMRPQLTNHHYLCLCVLLLSPRHSDQGGTFSF